MSTEGPGPAPTPTRPAAAAGAASFDSATRDDAEFNRRFRHEFADVDGVRMHYVTGGTGEPLVLLHGWPYGGTSFGGTRTESPFTDAQIDEFARTYSRPQVLTGGFELYRTLDEGERDNSAAAPIRAPTMLMTAEGTLAAIRAQARPRMANINRAVEVPKAGHWLP